MLADYYGFWDVRDISDISVLRVTGILQMLAISVKRDTMMLGTVVIFGLLALL